MIFLKSKHTALNCRTLKNLWVVPSSVSQWRYISLPCFGYNAKLRHCNDIRTCFESMSENEFIIRHQQTIRRFPALFDFKFLEFLYQIHHNCIGNPTQMEVDTTVYIATVFDSFLCAFHYHPSILFDRLEIIINQIGVKGNDGDITKFLVFKMYWSVHCGLKLDIVVFNHLIIFFFLCRIVTWF